MKILAQLFILLFIFSTSFQSARACTCAEYYTPDCVKVIRTDAVFAGRIEKLFMIEEKPDKTKVFIQKDAVKHSEGGEFFARFSVIEKYKGEIGRTIDVYSYIGTSCTTDDSNMKIGDRWTIYANFDSESKQWFTGIGGCSYSHKENKDSFLQDYKNNKTKETVEGRIIKDGAFGDGIPNIPVRIEGAGFTDSTLTISPKEAFWDTSGLFHFNVPSAGKYKVSFTLPSSLQVGSPYELSDLLQFPTEKETTVEYFVNVQKGLCSFNQMEIYRLDLKATASISGKFVSDESKTFPKFYPILCKLKETEKETIDYNNCVTEYNLTPDGQYKFQNLREGKYVVIVNENDFPELNTPYLRLFYPGNRNFSEARIINLEQGQNLVLSDFKLPSPMPLQEVRGKLFWKHGVPVTKKSLSEEDVYFQFYDPLNPKYSISMSKYISPNETEDGITLHEDGSFIFHAFAGITYKIRFSADNKKGRTFAKEIEIKIDDNLKPLEIVLEKVKNK